IEAQPADERAAVGFRSRRNSLRFEPGQHKAIDGVSGPALIFDRWGVGPLDRAKRPVRRSGLWSRVAIGRPSRPLVDPRPQQGDVVVRELVPLGGHDQFGVEAGDILDKETVGAFANLERRPRVATTYSVPLHVEPQTRMLF